MYIDVHAHLTDKAFADEAGVMSAIKGAGVGLVICSGYDVDSSLAARSLAEKYDFVYFSAGFQPQELHKYKEGDLDRLRALWRHEKCLAAGEIGLDYHYEDNPPEGLQKELFAAQLRLADEAGLPVVIHSRSCAADTLSLLRENCRYLRHGGVLHCYSYAAEMVADFEALGLYFSFGGTSTYDGAKKVQKSAARVSPARILTETDSPYLTPVPLRGQFPNTPANIPYIAKNLARLRGESEAELVRRVWENAARLFQKLPSSLCPDGARK